MKNILISGSGLVPLRRPPAPVPGAGVTTAGRNPGRAAALAAPHPAVGPGKGLTFQKFNNLYIREAIWFSELSPMCLLQLEGLGGGGRGGVLGAKYMGQLCLSERDTATFFWCTRTTGSILCASRSITFCADYLSLTLCNCNPGVYILENTPPPLGGGINMVWWGKNIMKTTRAP